MTCDSVLSFSKNIFEKGTVSSINKNYFSKVSGNNFKYQSSNIGKMEILIVLEQQKEGGFTVFVPSLPGCISQGDNKEDAINNIKEAIELYLEPDTSQLASYSGEKIKV